MALKPQHPVRPEGGVKGRGNRFAFSLPEMQNPGPKLSPAEQPVGVGGVKLLSLEESLPGPVPDVLPTASAGEPSPLLVPSISAVEELPHPTPDVAAFLW